VSFDDDSYPVDPDFFATVERLFSEHAKAAIFAAKIWHRHERKVARSQTLVHSSAYVGCGYAIRLAAYRRVRGYIPRPVAYGMEECDLSLQLFADDWHIYEAGNLRVFHDTDLKHHGESKVTSGVIENAGLYAFLHYPVIGWGLGLAQVANKVAYCIRVGRFRGIWSGICGIPAECYVNRHHRKPVTWKMLQSYLRLRRSEAGAYVTPKLGYSQPGRQTENTTIDEDD
jgi:hypothetical protein